MKLNIKNYNKVFGFLIKDKITVPSSIKFLSFFLTVITFVFLDEYQIIPSFNQGPNSLITIIEVIIVGILIPLFAIFYQPILLIVHENLKKKTLQEKRKIFKKGVVLLFVLGLLIFLISCIGEQDDIIGDCFVAPDPERVCTEEAEPVCACNDLVYSNSCYAEKAGNLKWKSTNKNPGENCDYE